MDAEKAPKSAVSERRPAARVMVGPEIERRRRRLMAGVAGLIVLAAVVVVGAYAWRGLHREKPVAVPPNLPANVDQQAMGYTFTRSEGGQRIFTIHAARTVAFKQGGTSVLDDVYVEVFGKDGKRHDIVRTQRAGYNSETGDFTGPGAVEIQLNSLASAVPGASLHAKQPVFLETSGISFQQQGSLVTTQASVRFRIGPLSGSALGMEYATGSGQVDLDRNVVVELAPRGGVAPMNRGAPAAANAVEKGGESSAPAPSNEGVTRLDASHLRFDKDTGLVMLDGPVELSQGTQHVVADRGVIRLDEQNRISNVRLEDNIRASDTDPADLLDGHAQDVQGDFDPATGALVRMMADGGVALQSRRPAEQGDEATSSRLTAQKIDMSFTGIHAVPKAADATGDVEFVFEPAPAAASTGRGAAAKREGPTGEAPRSSTNPAAASFATDRNHLTAEEMQFAFRPAGSLKSAETVGAGKLVLQSRDPKVGDRTVTAGQFLMAFDTRNRLETLNGVNGTRVVYQPAAQAAPGAVPEQSISERLLARFDPATEALVGVDQSGDFEFRDGDRQSSADQAKYVAARQTLTLAGRPRLWDAATRVVADHIVWHVDSETAEALGHVQATHFEGSEQAGAGGGAATGAQAETTNILADSMLAARRAQFVHYQGNVRAWHGTDVVESPWLDYYGETRELRSGVHGQTSHLVPRSLVPLATASGRPGNPSQPKLAAAGPLTIRFDRLEFFDAGRKAAYRGNVELQVEQTTMRADQMDVYFSGRGGTGKGSDVSEVERAVAEGHVVVTEPGRRATGNHGDFTAGDGKIVLTGGPPTVYDEQDGFTTGQSLTFYVHDDRLFVDGGNQSPTLAKRHISQ